MAKVEEKYGMKAALIGTADTDSTLTKSSFFAAIEAEYPSKDGWKVVDHSVVPLEQNFQGTKFFLPYVVYHLEKG